ncbi:MAG: antitoxin Xre/MbcA/ParS toxin-binding domain-containing protein [Ottowia sp.]|nr:DUF2384 domain-containing protein [Ottowia sp.]
MTSTTLFRPAPAGKRGQASGRARVQVTGKAAASGPAAPHSVYTTMGELIGVPLRSEQDILRLQQAGVPMRAFNRLTRSLPAGGEQVIGSRSSLRRRAAEGVLSESESEKALRVTRVLARAMDLFGNEEQARNWFARPADYVRGAAAISPLQLCAYEVGARIVENKLLRTRYGVF